MDVVDGGSHPDDPALVDRHGEVVPRVGEELGRPSRVDGVVEDAGRDVVEHGGVAGAEQADDWAHRRSILEGVHD